MPNIIVGTAGHIDHGKTSLVRALTGIDADRLKEEQQRGITIDIGFANLRLEDGTTLGFVDVPGHERFIKNMLAGVGGIDLVMLVVAADESVMPQTREHLEICSLLQIKRGLTVLTKIDVTDPEIADLAEVEVREFLQGSFLAGAPVLRVSSQTGEGIPELVRTLAAHAAATPAKDASTLFRLPVDRCFTMKGFGTVVTGTLVSGTVRRDEEVEVLPQGRPARVRGIQVHGGAAAEARAGQRTALNLQRIDLEEVARGMVVAHPGIFQPTSTLDVHLELLPSAPAPIVRRKRVRFHAGTAELMGYAVLLGQDRLEPGGSAFAQLLLESPTVAVPGDRFIVRQYSPMTTIGGGEILDPHPRRHRRSDDAVPRRLRQFQQAALEERLHAFVREAGVHAAELPSLAGRAGQPHATVQAALESLARDGRIRILAGTPLVVADADVFSSLAAAVQNEVQRVHETDPLVIGIGRDDLKGRLLRNGSALLFKAVLESLVAERQLALQQDIVHAFNRTVRLGEEDSRIRDAMTERFRALGLQAPAVADVIAELGVDPPKARKILQILIKEQVLVKIAEDIAVEREALQKLISDVRAMKSSHPTLNVGEFKDLTGLSRKFAMPLLEYLDGQRVTRRAGDQRVIL